jgi:hypothetical protein
MSFKQTLIDALPPFRNERVLIKKHQGTNDIIVEILEAHTHFGRDYDRIYEYFDTGNIYGTCQKIWNFEKQNLTYDAETGKDQSSKSPSAILHPGERVDCKHYALFASGILDAIKQNDNVKWDWFYRFASDKDYNNVSHVFVVVTDGKTEIWIDPCLSNFDQRKKYIVTKDEQPMALYRISGINDIVPDKGKTVDVDKQTAFRSFLIMLQKNMFARTINGTSLIKTLMNDNPAITNGPVKAWFIDQGFNWNQVEQFLNS